MQSNGMRVIAGIAVVAVAVVLLIVLKDDGGDGDSGNTGKATAGQTQSPKDGGPSSDDGSSTDDGTSSDDGTSAQDAVPTIVVKGGEPLGGVRDLTYKAGDRIRFQVESDVGDEIHVHGYDLTKDVEAGGSVRFDFPADIEGVFEAELEGRGVQIVELTVNP